MNKRNFLSKLSGNSISSNRMVPVLLVVLALMVVIFSTLNPLFISLGNIKSLLTMAAGTGIMAVGLSMVVLTGNFDFSVGSTLGLTVVIVAKLINAQIDGVQLPLVVALASGLAIGALIGAVNGFLVNYVGLHSIIVTLGTLSIIRGITYWVIIDNIPVRHPLFLKIGRYFIGGFLPVNFLIWVAILFLMSLFLKKTKLGRHMYLTGSNPTAALLSGVNIKKTQFITYIISGCAAAMGGIIRLSQIGFSDSTFGTGYEFHVLVICVLGGISLLGGRGNLLGVFIATLIVGSITNGLVLADVEVNWREAFIGLILIAALLMDIFIMKRQAVSRSNPEKRKKGG